MQKNIRWIDGANLLSSGPYITKLEEVAADEANKIIRNIIDGFQAWQPYSYVLIVDDDLDAINSGRDVFQIPYDEDIAINVSTDAIVRAML